MTLEAERCKFYESATLLHYYFTMMLVVEAGVGAGEINKETKGAGRFF
jgi:hypothetical protein